MKIYQSLLFLLCLFFVPTFAQSFKISPKKVVYTRKTTQDNPGKQTFTVTYPIISGAKSPAIKKKIESALNYEKLFDTTIKDELAESTWLDEFSYVVSFKNNSVLDVMLTSEGSAAYPSGSSKHVIVNISSGAVVSANDVFTNLSGLAAKCRKAQQAEMKKSTADLKKDPDSADFDPSEYFKNAKFGTRELEDFSVSEKGIMFEYDYGFPHVALALQPDGAYFFTWAEMKPFVKKDGIFGQFVK